MSTQNQSDGLDSATATATPEAPPEQDTQQNVRHKAPLTLEECIYDAISYSSRTQWCLNSNRAYSAALKNGWMDQCCAHMTGEKAESKPQGYWTKEKCKEFADKCTTRTGWARFHNVSYNAARKGGWLEELTAHMAPVRYISRKKRSKASTHKTTPKKAVVAKVIVQKVAKKAPQATKPIFGTNHNSKGKGIPQVWTKADVISSAKPFSTPHQWRLMESSAYKAAKRNNWVKEATAHMNNTHTVSYPVGYWTKHRVIKEAKNFDTKIRWAAYHPTSYSAARVHGWLEVASKHMVKTNFGRQNSVKKTPAFNESKYSKAVKAVKQAPTKTIKQAPVKAVKTPSNKTDEAFEFAIKNEAMMPRGYWTRDRVRLVAKRFNSRLAWRKATPYVYNIATFKGWLNSLTKHMTDSRRMVYHPSAIQKQSLRKARQVKLEKAKAAKASVKPVAPIAKPTINPVTPPVASIAAPPAPIEAAPATVEAPATPVPEPVQIAAPVAEVPAPIAPAAVAPAPAPKKKSFWDKLGSLLGGGE